ncbi:MAG: hypothetical protein M1827_001594 [Pycnora praestabilis]|nr:MAG: hypothetical protein M1827_001594 [Pycnora praestabilis]
MSRSKIERMKLLMGDDALPSSDNSNGFADYTSPKGSSLPEFAAKPQAISMDLASRDLFHGSDYRDDNVVPAFATSDSDDPPALHPHPSTGTKKSTVRAKRLAKTSRQITQSSTNLAHSSNSPEDNALDMRFGELAPAEQAFCPIQAVAKFPYKYINKEAQESIAQTFFAGGRFWERTWDLYYIHPPSYISVKPLVLIPSTQVTALIEEINTKFNCHLRFPRLPEEIGFLLTFSSDHTPRPRYLGQVRSRSKFDSMAELIPNASYQHPKEAIEGPLSPPSDRSLAAFKKKMELAVEATKNKSKASNAKKKLERDQRKQSWVRLLKRTQRYLGVRPRCSSHPRDQSDYDGRPDSTWEEHQAVTKVIPDAETLSPAAVNVDEPVNFPFDSSVVFISVDVEAYERDHHKITEIGISTLDTRDLKDIAPGDGGKNWHRNIRARHFRIIEHGHLHNTEFVSGCADKFEFGQSEWISIKDAKQVLSTCFQPPFSRINSEDPKSPIEEETRAWNEDPEEKRNIVLVGHDTSMDIKYLQGMGYNPLNLSNLLEISDTASLFRALKHETDLRSLGMILYEFDLTGWNLHNAGNDAAYTLQAMITISIKALQQSQTTKEAEADEKKRKVEEAIKKAEDMAADDAEGWSEDDGDDGGVPLKAPPASVQKDAAKNRHNAKASRAIF